MNMIQRAMLRMAGIKAAQPSGPTRTFTPMDAEFVRWFGMQSKTGITVTEDSALGVSASWSCQRVLSETIGSLPWAIYRQDPKNPKNAERADDHPLVPVLLGSPNMDQTSVEFREALTMGLTSAGNAYAWREDVGAYPASLTPLRTVKPMRKSGSNTSLNIPDGHIFFKVLDRGKWNDYPRSKIWQVKGFGRDALEGLSPLGFAREAMGFALATEEFGSKFFAQGGKPSGTVTTDKFLTKEQREIARGNLQQMLGGLSNAHKFALFEGGMKPEPWGDMPLDDMQFLLLRKFSVEEICRFYRVPPHMVASLDKATFSNIEQQSQEFVMFTLLPYFVRIEAAVQKWLLPAKDQGKFFLRFNFEGLLRADSAARSQLYSQALQNGWMTRNEVRAKENLNSSTEPGMDSFTAQSNLLMIDKLEKQTQAAPTPNAPEKPPVATPPTGA